MSWSRWKWGGLLFALILFVSPAEPATAARCVGDCDENLQVAVSEIVTCIDVALGRSAAGRCASCNTDADSVVGIPDLLVAVANSLAECPADLVPVSASIRVSPAEGCVENPNEIETSLVVCIANQGQADAGVFSVGVQGGAFARFAGLSGGDERCTEGDPITGEVNVLVDSDQEVREDDEENNLRTFVVGTPVLPPLCTATPTATATVTGSRTATSTGSPTPTATATRTSTATSTVTRTVTSTDSPTPTSTTTPTTTPTPTSTATETITPTATRTPTVTPTSDLPDLVPVNVQLIDPCIAEPGGMLEGQLEVFVTNIGLTASGPFNITVNGQPFARVATVAPNGGSEFPRGPLATGMLEVEVDSDDEVEEADEANNVLEQTVPEPVDPPVCSSTPTSSGTATRTPTVTPTPSPSPTPTCPLLPGRYTMTQLEGSQLLIAPPSGLFPFASGGKIILDVGEASSSECVHPLTVPFPGGLDIPIFCIEGDVGLTVRLDQIGCGVGAIDSNGGSDFSLAEIGDTSDSSATCNLPHLQCMPGGDDSIRTDVTVGDGMPDSCLGGGTANLIVSLRASIQAWIDPEECPDSDGIVDGEDLPLVSLSQTLDLTTATSRADFADLDADGCCIAGSGPASVTNPCEEGVPENVLRSDGACLNLVNRTVTTAATAPIGATAPPLNDIAFALQLQNILTGPELVSGPTCDNPPSVDFDGTVTRCIP